MSSSFCCWCNRTKWGRWGNLRFYIFVFGVKQVEWGNEVSPIFSFLTQGFWELPLRSTTSEVALFSVWSVCRWLSQLRLVFVLLRVDATLGDGFGIWEHLSSFREVNCLERVFLKLYGWVYKTFKTVVMTAGSHSRQSQIESYGKPYFRFSFYEIYVQNQWGHNILRS